MYAECLGYIGYYFGGKMLDYPGLVAPEVVRARRAVGDRYELIPEVLKPEWIVARQGEAQELLKRPAVRDAYEIVAKEDARSRLDAHGPFAGDTWLRYDGVFYVLRLKAGAVGQR